jgi:hypothetical protein
MTRVAILATVVIDGARRARLLSRVAAIATAAKK